MHRYARWFAPLLVIPIGAPQAIAQNAARGADSLPIPLPAGARVHVAIDARDSDLLGTLKSCLKGFDAPTLKGLVVAVTSLGSAMAGAPRVVTFAIPILAGMTGGRAVAPEASLADVLKDVRHVRLILFTPAAKGSTDNLAIFHEKSFLTEGGRRVFWAQAGQTRLLVVDFPTSGGWAVVALTTERGPALVTRADGYPDLQAVVPLLAALLPGVRVIPGVAKVIGGRLEASRRVPALPVARQGPPR